MRKIKRKITLSVFSLVMIFFGFSSFGQGPGKCIADDPGECVRNCENGLACCVGTSPHCSGGWSTEKQSFWIDCGNGKEYCSTEPY